MIDQISIHKFDFSGRLVSKIMGGLEARCLFRGNFIYCREVDFVMMIEARPSSRSFGNKQVSKAF